MFCHRLRAINLLSDQSSFISGALHRVVLIIVGKMSSVSPTKAEREIGFDFFVKAGRIDC